MTWGYTNNSSSSNFSFEDMQEMMKELKSKQVKSEMDRCQINIDFLEDPCNVCGHRMRIDGHQRIFVCSHRIEFLKKHVQEQDPTPASVLPPNPFASSFIGFQIIEENKDG